MLSFSNRARLKSCRWPRSISPSKLANNPNSSKNSKTTKQSSKKIKNARPSKSKSYQFLPRSKSRKSKNFKIVSSCIKETLLIFGKNMILYKKNKKMNKRQMTWKQSKKMNLLKLIIYNGKKIHHYYQWWSQKIVLMMNWLKRCNFWKMKMKCFRSRLRNHLISSWGDRGSWRRIWSAKTANCKEWRECLMKAGVWIKSKKPSYSNIPT